MSRGLGFGVFWGNGKAGRILCVLAERGFLLCLGLLWFLHAGIEAGRRGVNCRGGFLPLAPKFP